MSTLLLIMYTYLGNGHLQLSNGTSGILEVYLNGWKRVCSYNNYGISQAVANVACRYLGYRDVVAFSSIYISYTTKSIFPNPRCLGNETNILECVYDLASTCYYESYISCRIGTVYEALHSTCLIHPLT